MQIAAAPPLQRAHPAGTARAEVSIADRSVFLIVLGSTLILVGVMWDISWHATIGRDTFWSPPHLLVQAGGMMAGLTCGWAVLRTSFAAPPAAREGAVRFWRYFHGPLGGWMVIWGAIAMATSAPFDDWWHGTYGLDVAILSPPHSVLAAGVTAVHVGALLLVLLLQNRSTGADVQRFARLHGYMAGILVMSITILVTEQTHQVLMHSPGFYKVVCAFFPALLVSAAAASRLRWPATVAALVYSALQLALVWILPLFEASPKLGPIYSMVTHMMPPAFPLLLVVPAVGIDLLFQRWKGERPWRFAALLGVAFFASFVAVQWPFAEFLVSSPLGSTWVFAADAYSYTQHDPGVNLIFQDQDVGLASVLQGMAVALVFAVLSARAGLGCGRWMRRVQR